MLKFSLFTLIFKIIIPSIFVAVFAYLIAYCDFSFVTNLLVTLAAFILAAFYILCMVVIRY